MIVVFSYIRVTPRLEVHNAVLNALMCVITTAFITNLIKLGVRAFPGFLPGMFAEQYVEKLMNEGVEYPVLGSSGKAVARV